jgi:hypothetical protein
MTLVLIALFALLLLLFGGLALFVAKAFIAAFVIIFLAALFFGALGVKRGA